MARRLLGVVIAVAGFVLSGCATMRVSSQAEAQDRRGRDPHVREIAASPVASERFRREQEHISVDTSPASCGRNADRDGAQRLRDGTSQLVSRGRSGLPAVP